MKGPKEFFFGSTLTPEAFLARGFLAGVALATITGVILVVLGVG